MAYELEYDLLTELQMVEGESAAEYVNVVAREARLEIERLRVDAERADASVAWLTSKIGHLLAAGDALVAAIRNHDLAEAHLKAWQEARRG